MNLIQSTTFPTSGNISVNGVIGSFINLGVGFFQDFTGRENVYYKSMLMGINKSAVNVFLE